MNPSTAIRKILEEDFKYICQKMVDDKTVTNLSVDELFNKYIGVLCGSSDTPTSQKSSSAGSSSTKPKKKRALKGWQVWSKEDEAKELIKDYCKKNPTDNGKGLKFMSGVHILWKELPEDIHKKYDDMALELNASA
jgi:hypothetical protein